MRASVSRAAELRTAVKVAWYPRARRQAPRKNCSHGAPTRQLHEGGVCATRDRSKGDEERNARIGHHH
eukprot:1593268-Pleurochrysis_carterae.AAC.2